jgi:hypothetical protein
MAASSSTTSSATALHHYRGLSYGKSDMIVRECERIDQFIVPTHEEAAIKCELGPTRRAGRLSEGRSKEKNGTIKSTP